MIAVRGLAVSDAAAWRDLWRAYLDFYRTALPEAVYQTAFARLVAPPVGDYPGLVATAGGAPVDLAHYIFHHDGWQIEGATDLRHLFVAPRTRNSEAGRAPIEAVYAAADAASRPNAYWLTKTSNTVARRPYDRIGVATPFVKCRR